MFKKEFFNTDEYRAAREHVERQQQWMQYGPWWENETIGAEGTTEPGKKRAAYEESGEGGQAFDPAYMVFGKDDTPFQIASKLVEKGDVFARAQKLAWYNEKAGFGWLLRNGADLKAFLLQKYMDQKRIARMSKEEPEEILAVCRKLLNDVSEPGEDNPDRICLVDGIWDLKSNTFRPYGRYDIVDLQIPVMGSVIQKLVQICGEKEKKDIQFTLPGGVVITPGQTHYDKCVNTSLKCDPVQEKRMLEMYTISLTGRPFKKAFLLEGPTWTGKSTWLELLDWLARERHILLDDFNDLADKYALENQEDADALIILIPEVSNVELNRSALHRFKKIVSSDHMASPQHYAGTREMEIKPSCLMATNYRLFDDCEEAIRRRIVRIYVTGQIQPEDEDKDMLKHLTEEAPYIMMKVIEAGHEFVKRGHKLTPAPEIRWWEETPADKGTAKQHSTDLNNLDPLCLEYVKKNLVVAGEKELLPSADIRKDFLGRMKVEKLPGDFAKNMKQAILDVFPSAVHKDTGNPKGYWGVKFRQDGE